MGHGVKEGCRNRATVERLVRAAERSGYRALVVTVDAPLLGNRQADERNRFRLPPGLSLGNAHHATAPLGAAASARDAGAAVSRSSRGTEGGSGLANVFALDIDASLTWDLIPFLRSICSLPVVVKVRLPLRA